MNVLFVCTLNKARSVTAERLYRSTRGLQVRSAGIDPRAAHQLNENDLAWADLVVTFGTEHAAWIKETFTGDLPRIVDLGIPDEFAANDSALLSELEETLTPVIGPPSRRR